MSHSANKMTGEIVLPLGDVELRFKASLERMADFQGRLDVVGVTAATAMIQALDARALLHGTIALGGAENAAIMKDLNFGEHAAAISKALVEAIVLGMPDSKKK